MRRSEEGSVLILTLLVVAILTALIVEFTFGVYTTASALENWKIAQRLSFTARSGVTLAAHTLSDLAGRSSYTYPSHFSIPAQDFAGDGTTSLAVSVDDLSGRFNLNSLIYQNGLPNQDSLRTFRRLLHILKLDEKIADRIADWIDKDSEPRLGDSEEGAKNSHLDSPEEMKGMRGITPEIYDRLSPFVTVYGIYRTDTHLVNINTAPVPVIMSLDERVSEDLAQRIVAFRSLNPLEKTSDLLRIAGFEGGLGQSLMGRVTVKSVHFSITATARSMDISRLITATVEVQGGASKIVWWSEI